MIKHKITRRLEIDAGHRVYQHESKCNNLHGHRYVIELTVQESDKLDTLGRVIDFSVLKSICGKWLDDNWDHGMILWDKDPLVNVFKDWGANKETFQKFYVMPTNPTAENMARYLFSIFAKLLEQHPIEMVSVVIHETPNCKAQYDG